MEHLIHRVFMN